MTAEPIVLPPAPAEPRRPPVPFVAAIVPVAAGVILWQVTGSAMALCFALLGPLMIAGSVLDGIRLRRRERRWLSVETDDAWRRAEEEIAERRTQERESLWQRHPDALRRLVAEPLRDDEDPGPSTLIVVGRGDRPSALRLSGGEGERARLARQRAGVLTDAPVTARLGRGLCIRGAEVLGEAVLRALVAQLCLRFSAARLALVDVPEGWDFAHAITSSRAAFRLGIGRDPASPPAADAVLWLLPSGSAVPDGATAVIDVLDPFAATLRTAEGTQPIAVECLSAAQLEAIALQSARHVAQEARLPAEVRFADLSGPPATGLSAVIGRGALDDLVVDLVGDGPHAMVTGMTGAGKSELLVTWVCAIAAQRGPEEVAFVLADFKGGTAFDPLRTLPHVTAVLTDLDEGEASRGVRSLTAELRRRERVLAEAGARDIDDPGVRMPRLVIVVDEFAALLQEHPDLAAVFTDIAARGRALGMHLILGTQRAAGIIRDALAANCPLRISLRVADAADSRLVIGSDDAAALEGGAEARGIAFVRRPKDVSASAIRVALTGEDGLRAVAARWPGAVRPPSPWLPALPAMLRLDRMPRPAGAGLLLGAADEPERQSQPVIVLEPGQDRGMGVIGGPGSGKSAVLRSLRRQHPDAFVVPADAESAWDALLELGSRRPELVLCDDVDRMLATLPGEYALAFADRLELFLRSAQDSTTVLAFGRASGAVTRLMDALPRRLLLRTATRGEHLAAGGDSASFDPARPPGRGHLSGREVQVAWTEPADEASVPARRSPWRPRRPLVGVVGGGALLQGALRAELSTWDVHGVSGARIDPDAAGTALIGDAEDWQREWALMQRVRKEGEVLVLAENPAALRVLLGSRELPPYARTHAGRAWSVVDGGAPTRVVLPGLEQGIGLRRVDRRVPDRRADGPSAGEGERRRA
ncbi:FtsK/SpoIIIE domain-containing protein [Microbacterium tumbae]